MNTSTRATAHAALSETQRWHRAAQQLGIDACYQDGLGQTCTAPLETIRAAMAAMGAPITSPAAALRWIGTQQVRPSPVKVAWDGGNGNTLVPYGCHQNERGFTLSAPRRYPAQSAPRVGAFLPLYALRSERSLGIGDLSDLGMLARACERDFGFVATLPLFANFTDDAGADASKFDPSPYAPISRSFFSELYLDPRATPEWDTCTEAHTALEARRPALAEELAQPNVDYAKVARLRRPVLQALADAAGELGEGDVVDYAHFRAHGDPNESRFHRYVQVRIAEQLEALSDKASLYLDLPVGVHRAGFDADRFAGDFLPGFSAGAPPDAMFRSGQCWGISALNPIGARKSAYASLRAGVETLSRYARLLRLDHVMALHRTFCVPDGAEASEGVYIRAQPEELYAALLATAASAKRPPVLIGEDLGTVPAAVRKSLALHGVLGMHVAQLEPALPVVAGSCASINTHDLATFAAYAAGDDLRDFADLGFLESAELEASLVTRSESVAVAGTYAAIKAHVVESEAAHVVLNLEDEWGERRPQNTPGTSTERANFKRRAALSLSALSEHLNADPTA
ncbi:MAG: 4-alpha-glucanotransferase [Polyangiales bacterium]